MLLVTIGSGPVFVGVTTAANAGCATRQGRTGRLAAQRLPATGRRARAGDLRGGTPYRRPAHRAALAAVGLQGGQRLATADLAHIVGVREGRVRQVLGPLRTAHRDTIIDREERPVVVEDAGQQAWLDRAASRGQDSERCFPEPGEQVKAAEAKAICADCQVRDRCLELAVKAAGGLDCDHGVFGSTLRASVAHCAATPSRSRAPAGSSASWPSRPTSSPARFGCGRPPAGWASTATP
jgi:hypothetical protein